MDYNTDRDSVLSKYKFKDKIEFFYVLNNQVLAKKYSKHPEIKEFHKDLYENLVPILSKERQDIFKNVNLKIN